MCSGGRDRCAKRRPARIGARGVATAARRADAPRAARSSIPAARLATSATNLPTRAATAHTALHRRRPGGPALSVWRHGLAIGPVALQVRARDWARLVRPRVYRARRRSDGREVAVKVIQREKEIGAGFQMSFEFLFTYLHNNLSPPRTWHLSHRLDKYYIQETANPSIRADAIGATASQAFVTGSYRSTELRRSPL